jgi:Yip1-like protein
VRVGTAGGVVFPETGQSFAARVAGVFLSPLETFAVIARRPDFWPSLILGIAGNLLVAETVLARVGMARVVRSAIEQSARSASMTPEQLEQAVRQGARFGTIFTHLGGLLGAPVFLLVLAAVGMAISSAIFGSGVNFKTAFSIACYANLVNVLEAVIAVVMILFGDPDHFNPRSPVPTSLGFFLDPQRTSKPFYALATSLDLFSFWLMALLGIGFSAAIQRRARPFSVFLCFFGLWTVLVLARMGWSSLG